MKGAVGQPPRENITAITKIAAQHFGIVPTIDQTQLVFADAISALGRFRDSKFENKVELSMRLAHAMVNINILKQIIDPEGVAFEDDTQSALRAIKAVIRDQRADVDKTRPPTVGEGNVETPG